MIEEKDFMSSTSNKVCKNLYVEFYGHANPNQENSMTALGDNLSTSSLQEVSQEVMEVIVGGDTQDTGTMNGDCINTSDFYDISYETLHLQGPNAILEMSLGSTQERGINDTMYDADSCTDESDSSNQTVANEFEDSIVGIEPHDCKLEEHAVELSVEGHSSSTLDVDMRIDDSTHHNVSNSDSFQSGSLLWNGQ